MIIEVKNINRSFRSSRKKEGLSGTLKQFFNPEYQWHEALKNVSFTLERGSFNGLIGANGAGKTTLLKILSGLIPPSSGEAHVLGHIPFKRTLEFRRKIALVMGQKAQLWWDLPAIDAFDLLKAIYEIPSSTYRERLTHLSEILDVTPHLQTQIRRLSLGERMKMELIGAILHWPSVIFLDEPTIGLDVLAAHKLRQFLKEFNQKEKATIILTSHNMDDIERLCSRVLILKSGKLIYDDKPEGLVQKGERCLRVRLFEHPELSEVQEITQLPLNAIESSFSQENEMSSEHPQDNQLSQAFSLHTQQEDIPLILQNLMKRFRIVDIKIEEPSLEAVIQRLYEEERATVQ